MAFIRGFEVFCQRCQKTIECKEFDHIWLCDRCIKMAVLEWSLRQDKTEKYKPDVWT